MKIVITSKDVIVIEKIKKENTRNVEKHRRIKKVVLVKDIPLDKNLLNLF